MQKSLVLKQYIFSMRASNFAYESYHQNQRDFDMEEKKIKIKIKEAKLIESMHVI